MKPIKTKEPTIYILVHADDFAISKSIIHTDHDKLKQTIRARCRVHVRRGDQVVFTDLDADNPPLPEYLTELEDAIVRIPNHHTGNLRGQIADLKSYLVKQRNVSHYTFAGGWRDACLRHTVNQVAHRKPRLKVSETGLPGIEAAELQHPGYRSRKITIDVDWQNVF